MKHQSKIALLTIATLAVVACTKRENSEQTKDEQPILKISNEQDVVTPPTGRWLVNLRHCENILDVRNVVDMNVVANGVTKGNVLIRGKWIHVDGEKFKPMIEEALGTFANCFSIDSNKLKYTQLDTSSSDYVFASQKGTNVLFLIENGTLKILTRFDESLLSKYVLVDSLNPSAD